MTKYESLGFLLVIPILVVPEIKSSWKKIIVIVILNLLLVFLSEHYSFPVLKLNNFRNFFH